MSAMGQMRTSDIILAERSLHATGVCAENFIRIDLVTESHNVGHDGRADISLLELGCLALQVQEPT